jgi:hypothetical protein
MEAHVGKIPAPDPGSTLSSVYFRIAPRGAPHALRAPYLERLIARADEESRVSPWRSAAWRMMAPDAAEPPAIALAQLRASGHTESHEWLAMATPVHLVAGMSNVALPAEGILEIDALEADSLAAAFNRSFGGHGARLIRVARSGLVCALDTKLAAETTPPDEALGGDVYAHQPRGEGSAQLRRLSTEIEMWLFDHELNAARRSRALPVINALWLWGGGAGDAPLPRMAGWAAGDDVLFSTFDRRLRYPAASDLAGDHSGPSRSGVIVVAAWPGSAEWEQIEPRWLGPAIEDLKARRLSRVDISAAGRSFRLSARGLRRFWRRSRPWWQAFDVAVASEQGDALGG